MRKAIWLLAGLFALFTMAGTAVASVGCVPLGANGKLATSFSADGCTVQVKVVSTLTDACVEVFPCDDSVCVNVHDSGSCPLIAPLDTGDTTVKTSCRTDTDITKIEAKVHCD